MNTENSLPNPFDEIEKRSAAEWERFLLDNPELLDAPGPLIPEASAGAPLLRCWGDVPNIFRIDAPAIEWMVEGILPRASVTLLAGEPGSYKTWLALALLRGVATGGNFLGRKCSKANVLYLDRENPLVVMRERLAVLGVEESTVDDCRIWGGWLDSAPPGIGDFRILEIARERRPLIVFDSLIRFHAAADENSATEMSMVMAELRALANVGATVVVLHHKPKSEGSHYRGSSDIAGGVDTAWAVSRDRDAGLLRLECFKSRFAEEFSLTLRPELSGSVGEFVVTEGSTVTAAREDTDRLAQAVREKPGQTQRELILNAGVAQGRARALLAQFEGQFWRSERGLNNARRFFPLETAAGA